MNASLAVQYALIGVAVLFAFVFVWRSRFPRHFRATRVAIALPLVRDGKPDWMRALGLRIAPPAMMREAGCDVDCGGCH